jgi:hypothetical protein
MRARFARAPRLYSDPDFAWIFENLPVPDVWDLTKFQNNSGERPYAYHRFRYTENTDNAWIFQNLPVADVWDLTKFQNNLSARTPKRQARDLRFDNQRTPFAILDTAQVHPALDELTRSFRVASRDKQPIFTPDSFGWLFASLPAPFDPQFSPRSIDLRMADRDKRPIVTPDDLAWITANLPAFDPQLFPRSIDARMAAKARRPLVTPDDLAWVYSALFDPRLFPRSLDARMAPRKAIPIVTPDDLAWIFQNLPPFDSQLVIHTDFPTRMASRNKLELRLQQFYYDMAWIYPTLPVPPNLHRLFIDLDTGSLIWRVTGIP